MMDRILSIIVISLKINYRYATIENTASVRTELVLRVVTAILLPVEPLYCAKPVKFLSVSITADGAPVGVEVYETVYEPAAVLLQLTVALPD